MSNSNYSGSPGQNHSPTGTKGKSWKVRGLVGVCKIPAGLETLTGEAGEQPAELREPVAVEPLLGVLDGG